MKATIIAAVATLFATANAAAVFSLSTEPNGQGIKKTWFAERWECHDLAQDGIDNQASWAFVEEGLANGCQLYDEAGCTGRSVFIKKNNSNELGPGAVNLTDVNFDKIASAFTCV